MSLQSVNTGILETFTPRDFGDTTSEHEALINQCGLLTIPFPGLLAVTGKNAVQFINGLVTNDIKALEAGSGTVAAFLNLHGKVIAICRFYRTNDGVLIELDRRYLDTIFKNLSRFVPAGEFFVEDRSGDIELLSLQGPESAETLFSATGLRVPTTPEFATASCQIGGTEILIASHNRAGGDGFDLLTPKAVAEQLRNALIHAGAIACGSEALEIARIEAGIPREGVDVTEENILLEAGYENAVSYTKGCYLGQEIIARIHWRGQPAKQLRGLLIDAHEPPPSGTELWADDGKKIGVITSSVYSQRLGKTIGLGYVHRYYLTTGTRFSLKTAGVEAGQAEVAELPFIK